MATGDIWVSKVYLNESNQVYFKVRGYTPSGELITEQNIAAGPLQPVTVPDDVPWTFFQGIEARNGVVVLCAERYIYSFDQYGNTGLFLIDAVSDTLGYWFSRYIAGEFIFGIAYPYAYHIDDPYTEPTKVVVYSSPDGFNWTKKVSTGYESYLGMKTLWYTADLPRYSTTICCMGEEDVEYGLFANYTYDIKHFGYLKAASLEDAYYCWYDIGVEGNNAFFLSYTHGTYARNIAKYTPFTVTLYPMVVPVYWTYISYYNYSTVYIDKYGTEYYLAINGADDTLQYKFIFNPATQQYEKQTTAYATAEQSLLWPICNYRVYSQQAGYVALEYFACGAGTVRVTSDKYADFTIPLDNSEDWGAVCIETSTASELFWTENVKTREYAGAY